MTKTLKALNYIDGQWLNSTGSQTSNSTNPANGTILGTLVESTREDAQSAIAAAKRAFECTLWAHNAKDRQSVLLEWADRLEQRPELAKLLTDENGKVHTQARGEMAFAISEIRYYSGLARHIPGQFQEVEPGAYSATLREAAGVAGLIIPWNAPVILLIRALAPALAAGCSVVIKVAPETALILSEVMRELVEIDQLPAGVVNILHETGHEASQEIVTSADVDVLSFTGSNSTGQRIMAAAAPSMKKLSLELGGKSCCLVFPDVDIKTTASRLATAATIISGQQCTAARRILVHASIYDRMKDAIVEAFAALNVAPGNDPAAQIGPLISARALDNYLNQVNRAIDACDEVLLPGGRLGGDLSTGFFVAPTVVAHNDSNAFFCQDEIFGPFVVLERFENERDAVQKANNTLYGLSASVWTNDGDRGLRIARALRNGTVWINDHNRMFAEAETGGYRQSGIGRLHGYEGLGDFLETKHIFRQAGIELK